MTELGRTLLSLPHGMTLPRTPLSRRRPPRPPLSALALLVVAVTATAALAVAQQSGAAAATVGEVAAEQHDVAIAFLQQYIDTLQATTHLNETHRQQSIALTRLMVAAVAARRQFGSAGAAIDDATGEFCTGSRQSDGASSGWAALELAAAAVVDNPQDGRPWSVLGAVYSNMGCVQSNERVRGKGVTARHFVAVATSAVRCGGFMLHTACMTVAGSITGKMRWTR